MKFCAGFSFVVPAAIQNDELAHATLVSTGYWPATEGVGTSVQVAPSQCSIAVSRNEEFGETGFEPTAAQLVSLEHAIAYIDAPGANEILDHAVPSHCRPST